MCVKGGVRTRLMRKYMGLCTDTVAVKSPRDVGLAAGIFRDGVGPLKLSITVQLRRGVWPAVGCRRVAESPNE